MTRTAMNHVRLNACSIRCMLAAAMLASTAPAFAATCNSTGSGNWNAAIWSCAGGPGNNDDVVINNTHTVTLNVNSANIGSLTINNGGTLQGDGTGKILTLGKDGGQDFTNNGTLNFSAANAATLRLNKSSRWGGAGTWNFSVLDLNGKVLTFTAGTTATLNFSGAASPITNAGSVTSLATITWNFTGTTAQTLPNTNNVVYGSITVNNTAGVTLGIGLTTANILGGVEVQSGILNNGGFAITLPAGQDFEVQNGARFNLTGTSTMATVSGGGTKTFGATSTVDYAGTSQDVTAETYGLLILSGSGTKTPAAGTSIVAGNFTLASGVTYAGTTNDPDYQFLGNFSNSGTFNSGAGIYTFNGAGAQALTGASTFTNLTFDKTSGTMTLNNDVTVSTLLTLTNGIVATGANTLITTASCVASVSRSSGWVNGFLRKLIPAGNSTCTFEVGDAARYAPIVTSFTGATSGNLTGSTVGAEHPSIGASALDSSADASRYWTLTQQAPLAGTYSATFNFQSADVDAGADPANTFEVQVFSGGAWGDTTLGARSASSTQATGLTGFGEFATGRRRAPGGFNAYETTTAAGAITGVIKTKIAGASASVDVIALNLAKTAILTTFTGDVKVELLNAADNSAALDTDGCRSSWTPIQTLSTATFVAADNGRKTVSFTENNSYRNARLRMTYPTTGSALAIGCSSDNFAIRPNALSAVSVTDSDWQTAGTTRSLDNAAASGGNVHKAGQPFSVSATAVNAAAGVTTNYDGNPAFTITGVLQPALCGACTGTFATGTWSASSGTVSTTTATFDEAGVFTVTLDDQTYADVDIGDSTTAERYVPSAALSVGRFVPDHFDLSASNTPELQTFGVTDAACTTPTAGSKRSFTYIGQPFGYVTVPVVGVTARNAAGATTTNYRSGLWKVVASDVTQTYSSVPASPALAATINSPTVAAGSGTGTVTASSSDSLAYVRDTTAAAAEFSAQITLSVTVQDASESAVSGNGTIGSAAAAVFDGGGTGIAFDSGNAFRYGRLRLSNAHGSELLDLPLPIQTQYFNGSVFVTNSEDNCTTLQASDVKFDFLAGTPNLVACETRMNPTGTITFKSGASSTKLTKPGATNNGAVDLTVNLDALSGNTCVGASSSPATGAGKLYLQGDWGSGTYTEDPKARATFGVYKNADQFIYLRENF